MRPAAGDYKTTSFSGMEKWQTCSMLHSLHYGGSLQQSLQEPLLLGGLAHLIIEGILSAEEPPTLEDKETLLTLALPEFLKTLNLYEEFEDELYDLTATVVGMGKVLYRTYPQCKEQPIRNKDKSTPKDPINFPPGDFTKALVEEGLHDNKYYFDTRAGRINNFFIEVSMCWLLAKVVSMTFWWELSNWVEQTLKIECPISTNDENLVPFITVDDTTTFFKGYIDWVAVINKSVAIIDHKTSKKKPTELQVLHHPQLNLYSWAYKRIYGVTPKYIGINHLGTNSLILAELDLEIMTNTVMFYQQVQNNIEHQLILRHHPAEFNTPCIKTDWKSGVITPCPGFANCWPIYNEMLSTYQGTV